MKSGEKLRSDVKNINKKIEKVEVNNSCEVLTISLKDKI